MTERCAGTGHPLGLRLANLCFYPPASPIAETPRTPPSTPRSFCDPALPVCSCITCRCQASTCWTRAASCLPPPQGRWQRAGVTASTGQARFARPCCCRRWVAGGGTQGAVGSLAPACLLACTAQLLCLLWYGNRQSARSLHCSCIAALCSRIHTHSAYGWCFAPEEPTLPHTPFFAAPACRSTLCCVCQTPPLIPGACPTCPCLCLCLLSRVATVTAPTAAAPACLPRLRALQVQPPGLCG